MPVSVGCPQWRGSVHLGLEDMIKAFLTVAFAALIPLGAPALASDLLVAPTRIVLDGNTGGEVMVSNTGDKTTTYRISLVLRRMDASGQINPLDEALATPADAAALDIISYAPRKITLAPQQPQTVRIGVRAPPSLPPGEYRAHLLFRAVPDTALYRRGKMTNAGLGVRRTNHGGTETQIGVTQLVVLQPSERAADVSPGCSESSSKPWVG